MASTQAVKLTKLVEQFQLEILNQGKTYDRCQIRKDVINRPALQILGFFDYFDPSRLQLLGKVEWTYLSNQTAEERTKCFDDFFQKPIPALILARGLEPFPELMEMAVKHQRTILRSKEPTTTLLDNMTDALKARLTPRITRHGVLVDVSGEGVLIITVGGKVEAHIIHHEIHGHQLRHGRVSQAVGGRRVAEGHIQRREHGALPQRLIGTVTAAVAALHGHVGEGQRTLPTAGQCAHHHAVAGLLAGCIVGDLNGAFLGRGLGLAHPLVGVHHVTHAAAQLVHGSVHKCFFYIHSDPPLLFAVRLCHPMPKEKDLFFFFRGM